MKRIVIFAGALAVAMSMSTAALAVEKKEKKSESNKPPTAAAKIQSNSTPSADLKKKYDNFVDNNKNGIDDRSENLKPKSDPNAAKTAVTNKPAAKAPVIPAKVQPKKEEPKDKKPK